MILDYHLSFLRSAVRLVDEYLELLDAEVEESPDPDTFGLYDEIEYTTGFGFVACQTYMGAIIGRRKLKKKQALDLGPATGEGATIASFVNACANYWKHSGEWSGPELRDDAKRTVELISKLGVDTDGSYPLTNALFVIAGDEKTRFAPLLPLLSEWRDRLSGYRTA
jgi:hypothetical protein